MMAKSGDRVTTDAPAWGFVMEADRDYIMGRLISYVGANFAGRGWYFAQQALEKYLKGVSLQRSGGFLWTHNLKVLAADCVRFDSDFADSGLVNDLTFFDSYVEVGRYGLFAQFDPTVRNTPDVQVRAQVVAFPEHRDKFDHAVFKVRQKIDFATLGYPDNLRAVIHNDQSTPFANEWKLPIPLKHILTHENRYFR